MSGKGTMSPFGPFYPSELQSVVNHAERFADLVTRRCASRSGENATAWLLGRAEEIECFVRHIAHDWKFEGLSERAATETVQAYLDALHDGLAMHFGAASATCCAPDIRETAVPFFMETAPMPDACPPIMRTTTIDVDPSELIADTPTSFDGER